MKPQHKTLLATSLAFGLLAAQLSPVSAQSERDAPPSPTPPAHDTQPVEKTHDKNMKPMREHVPEKMDHSGRGYTHEQMRKSHEHQMKEEQRQMDSGQGGGDRTNHDSEEEQ